LGEAFSERLAFLSFWMSGLLAAITGAQTKTVNAQRKAVDS
jgi:hypothetical protein